MNVLILYGSLEGQTKKTAEYLADIIRNQGHQATNQPEEQLPANFRGWDQFKSVNLPGV